MHEQDAQFGRVICERRSRVANWFACVLMGGVGLVIAVLVLFGGTPTKSGSAPTIDPGTIVAVIAAIAFFAAAAYYARQALTSIQFREHAAMRTRLGKTLVIPYVDVKEFSYKLVRYRVNGIPAGTVVTIKLVADGKRRIAYSGRYRGRQQSKFLGLEARADDLDAMRNHISTIIADGWAERILAEEAVKWGPVTLTADGLTPSKGKYKGQVLPFEDIDRQSARAGWFSLFRRGDKRGFVSFQMAATNFWPGLMLFGRLAEAAQHPPATADSSR